MAGEALYQSSRGPPAKLAQISLRSTRPGLKFHGDQLMVAEGLTFIVKNKSDGTTWDIAASAITCAGDVLKKHKEVISKSRRALMPAFHQFFTEPGICKSMVVSCH